MNQYDITVYLLKENFVLEPECFFPGRLASSCIPNTSVDRKFNEILGEDFLF